MNPQHTVPVLDDNGQVLWDSHAICTYLIDKYSPDHSLYPKDLYTRARIDQRLHFDSGVLFSAIRSANFVVYLGGSEAPEYCIKALYEALDLLEAFLKNNDYLIGNSLTLADIFCVSTVVCFELHFSIEEEKYPKICEWIKRLSQQPLYDEFITEPMASFEKWFAEKKQQNAAINQEAN